MYSLHPAHRKHVTKMQSVFQTAISGILYLVCILISACAGSGSSGFDARAKAEQNAIAKVTKEGGCVDVENTVICAPGVNLANVSGINSDFLVSENAARLSIEPVSGARVSCLKNSDLQVCQIMVSVAPSDFAEGTQFFVSAHFKDTISWSNPIVLRPISSPGSSLSAVLTLETGSIMESSGFQIAVLVYGENALLPENQGEVPLLADFFPELVYAVAAIEVEIVPNP